MPGRDPTTHIYAGFEDVVGPVVDDRVETMFWSSIPLRTVDSVLNCSLLCLVLVLVLSPLWSAQLFRKPFPIISGIWSHLLYKSFLALFWNDGGWSVIWLQVLLPSFVMAILIAAFGVFLGGALDAEERTEWIDCLELFAGCRFFRVRDCTICLGPHFVVYLVKMGVFGKGSMETDARGSNCASGYC
ncbi:uncharacterized protein RAG0_00133 [Rhynchosporium agropyri]|uniref:Uncharacterized protein n=1 Tax=Rhynchosporium agropyri TaxID=914238 RepID=A0A1E1JRF1_9HELO|nr:uncharacterized protein RAG0_00133 [Rhynchosporium agropyri]